MARTRPRSTSARVVRTRKSDVCRVCQGRIEAGEQARLETVTGTLTCVLCVDDPLAALTGAGGAPAGSLRARLQDLAQAGVLALHQRTIPGSVTPVDHLAVTRTGIWVIDTARVAAPAGWRLVRPERSRGRARLVVNRRDETAQLARVDRHGHEVRRLLLEHDVPDVPVRGALCILTSDVRLLQRPLDVDGRLVTWPRALARVLARPGPLDEELREDLHRILAAACPPSAARSQP